MQNCFAEDLCRTAVVSKRAESFLKPQSIPPRATKKHQNHLRVVFSFGSLSTLT
jgi:hypothetical protein